MDADEPNRDNGDALYEEADEEIREQLNPLVVDARNRKAIKSFTHSQARPIILPTVVGDG